MNEYASIMRDFVNTLSGVEQQRFARFDSFSDAMKDPLISAKADIFYYSDDIANQMHDGAIRAKNERVLSFLNPANAESQVKSIVNDINAKSTKPPEFKMPEFKMPESPQLKSFKPSEFTPSTEFSDPSSGFGQYEVSQEEKDRAKKAEEQAKKTFEKREKNRATRNRIVSALKEQDEAVSSSGFLSWSKQQTRADESEKYRFNKAREYYKKNIDIIKDQNSKIEKAKNNFLKHKKSKDMISDASISEMKDAFEEAKQVYDQEVYDSKLAGIEAPEFKTERIDKQIAQKVFGKTGKAELSAVEYMRIKTHGEELIDRAQKRKDVIGKYLAPVVDKDGDRIARKNTKTFGMGFNQEPIKNTTAATTAAEKEIADIVEDVKPKGGLSWKGKAAIFGGVALGALALVGVASMVMSGGRQQNSNLYNPYQAMY